MKIIAEAPVDDRTRDERLGWLWETHQSNEIDAYAHTPTSGRSEPDKAGRPIVMLV